MTQPIAHISQNAAGDWLLQSLDDHCNGVADLAATFAAQFGMSTWGCEHTHAAKLLFDRVAITQNTDVPRAFADETITVNADNLTDGITIKEHLDCP